MKLGSLFAGIGGIDLGLERALGARTVWQVEQNGWARGVLERRWPDADRSVRDVRPSPGGLFPRHFTIHRLAPVDIVCGGFPCQDISPAGKGEGIHGKRSGLWGGGFVPVLRHVRPRYVVVENSHLLPHRGLDTVLGDLATLGYDAEWTRLGACDVGAPHRRWRTFIVAWRMEHADRERRPGGRCEPRSPAEADRRVREVADTDRRRRERKRWQDCHRPEGGEQDARGHEPDGRGEAVADPNSGRHVEPSKDSLRPRGHVAELCAEHVADTDLLGRKRFERPGDPARPAIRDPVPTPEVRRMVDGLPGWVGDGPMPRAIRGADLGPDGRAGLRALGNAVVPQVAYSVGLWLRSIIEREGL